MIINPGRYAALLVPVFLLLTPTFASASHCADSIAVAVSVQGTVEEKHQDQWTPVKRGAKFCAGDMVRVRKNSRAIVRMIAEQTNVTLDQHTTLSFRNKEKDFSWLELIKGAANFISRVPQTLKIKTAFVNAAVEGTEFLVTVNDTQTNVSVFEGHVALENSQGKLDLKTGDSGVAKADQAPTQSIKVNPVDAVQWTLYYPPVLSKPDNVPDGVFPPTLKDDHDIKLITYYAAQLLHLGRVEEAEQNIEKALALDRGDSNAMALRSIIAIIKNKKDAAIQYAKQAVESNQSAAGYIALSYAHQARFDLTAAMSAAQDAIKTEPKNAIAWARVADLWLSQAELDKALNAASKAAELDPKLAHSQTILGFAHLTSIDTDNAKQVFEKAISLDQAAPLPHLGLGLAMIREGHLEQGRIEIETATSLDPRNSLIRSYVGKAYYEEKRDELAAEQFALAKQLDPKDPTPWFYDAIRKLTDNNPVDALNDLQESIKLNDNRAVYRSSLLLDSDEASRNASQARIYTELGFNQLALLEGWKSVNTDPANHSGHRLLADSYASLPRHEIARVSELLQAQLLQPINTTPIQPQLAESSLGILQGAGPSDLSNNEFGPLFTRDGISVQANSIVGNNKTVGDDFVISSLTGKTAFSVSQFHYNTDGFRENNDQTHDILGVFAQVAVTPELNIQAEYRDKETDQGDIILNFDPANFSTTDRRRVKQNTHRFGAHYNSSTNSDFILSLINSDRVGNLDITTATGPIIDQTIDENGEQYEFQHIYNHSTFNTVSGISSYKIDLEQVDIFDWTPVFGMVCPTSPPLPPFVTLPPCNAMSNYSVNHDSAYFYSNIKFLNNMSWTLGISHDQLEDRALDLNETSPKVGVITNLTNTHKLRFAYFETAKRRLLVNQSIEPTHIAGFNQSYDDPNGTLSKRFGIGIDSIINSKLQAGLEGSKRELDVPQFIDPLTVEIADREEELYRAYLNWKQSNTFALTTELLQEKIDNNAFGPKIVKTTSLPIALKYFYSKQFSLSLKITAVDQTVNLGSSSTFSKTKDSFTITDLSINYRLPKHIGKISLEVKNIFDDEFLFQDLSDLNSEPEAPRYTPERTIFIKASINL